MVTKILIHWFYISACLLQPLAARADLTNDAKSTDGSPTAIAFINVNVVPMDRERIVPGQTVIVRGDRISEIGPVDATEIPEGTLRIDSGSKYLMPGLADMHVHLNYYDMVNLFLANGVTTVRNMWGFGGHLNLRDKIQKGEVIGPTIHTSGPIIDGNPPRWAGSEVVEKPDQAAQVVAEHKKAGYEFIKIYERLSVECFDALIEAAAKHEMPLIGHVPVAVDMEHALASGMYTMEHLVGYGRFLKVQDYPFWTKLDEGKISHIAQATTKAGVWNCPTIVQYDKSMMNKKDAQQELKRPYMRYVPASMKQGWFEGSPEDPNRATKVANTKRIVRALHDAGARILVGADVGNRYVVAGFSIHEELQNLLDSGLTPYEAIKAGTYDAAECLGQLDEFGVIRVGLRADLIMMEGNPLEDVSHIKNKTGVMVRGHWLPAKELQNMLDRVEASCKQPENRFAGIPAPKIEGEKIFSGHYELIYANSKMAEERMTVAKLSDGRNVVYAQTVADPPNRALANMELVFDETGKCYSLDYSNDPSGGSLLYSKDTSCGKNSLSISREEMELTVHGKLASGKTVNAREVVAEDTLLGTDMTASMMPLIQIAKSLKEGEKREVKSKRFLVLPDYSVSDKTMTLERAAEGTIETKAGVIPVQIFNIDTGSKKAAIVLDKEGHLLEYRVEFQWASYKYVRTE